MKPVRKRSMRVGTALLSLALVLTSCGGGGETGDEPFFEGRTLQVLVPASPGGGTDIVARLLAPYLKKHIEGKPDVQIENVPGGAGVVGANTFERGRKPDGTNAFLSSGSPHLPHLLQDPNVKFDFADMVPTLGTSAGAVVYVSPDTGIKKAADLADPAKPLHMAGQLPTGSDVTILVAWEMLGVDVDPTFGYEGKGPIRVAFEQGEANIDWQATPAYKENVAPLVEAGKAIPIMTFGQVEDGELVRDPAFPDLPTVGEVYEQIHGEPPSGAIWDTYKTLVSVGWSLQKVLWFHDEAPQEAVDAVKTAASEIAKDEEFVAEREKVLGPYPLITGEELESGVQTLTKPRPETVEWVQTFLRENYDVQFK